MKNLLNFQSGTGGSVLLIILAAKLLGVDLSEQDASDLIVAVEQGGWPLVAFIAGFMVEKGRRDKESKQ